jgi:hypothetical protein
MISDDWFWHDMPITMEVMVQPNAALLHCIYELVSTLLLPFPHPH